MKLKLFISVLTLCSSISAHAAFAVCQYQEQPCDQNGNHYLCRLVGWVGPDSPESCEPRDPRSHNNTGITMGSGQSQVEIFNVNLPEEVE